MSSIKPKTGACEVDDCSYSGRIIGKKCPTHYWQHRASLKKKSSPQALKTSESNKAKLDAWFEKQIQSIPTYCQECGTNLTGWKHVLPKAIIAHILPKRKIYGFTSVATHPKNRMFFCPDCHTDYDNKDAKHVRSMVSFQAMKECVQNDLMPELTQEEINRLPTYFTESNEQR